MFTNHSPKNIFSDPSLWFLIFSNIAVFFFLFHYGLFHAGYFFFLLTGKFAETRGSVSDSVGLKFIVVTAMLFFINHLFSYFYNKPKDTEKQNIGSLMFYPYLRIIPMHLTIISSSFFTALIAFLLLKTFADVAMHIVEHRVLRKGEEEQPSSIIS